MGARRPGLVRVGMRRAGAGATGAGSFPGFGGSPPNVASSSVAGATGLASDAGHTHGLDLVHYVPSVAGMQASGVMQQTYAAPNATPSVLTMTATNIPFGIVTATGLLSQDNRFRYSTTAAKMGIATTNAIDFANTANNGILNLIRETGGFSNLNMGSVSAAATSGTFARSRRCRGTWAVPTIVAAGDVVADYDYLPFDSANFLISLAEIVYVPSDAVPAAGSVPQTWAIQVNDDAGNPAAGETSYAFKADSRFNVYTGRPNAVAASTDGFFYLPAVAGIQTGVPNQVFGSVRAQNRIPHMVDTTDQRLQAYIGGAWHFTTYDDYNPTATRVPFGGATAHTLTDSPRLTYTEAAASPTLTIGDNTAASNFPALVFNGTNTNVMSLGFLNGGATASAWESTRTAGGAGFVSTVIGNINVNAAGNDHIQLASLAAPTAVGYFWTATNDVALGALDALAVGAVNGFVFLPVVSGIPTGAPARHGAAAGPRARLATVIDSTDHRWYYNADGTGAGWHFSTFTDYDPTATRIPFGGATAHTLVDSDTLAFTVTASRGLLTLGTTAVGHDGTMVVNSGPNGASLGAPGKAAIYVVDPNAAGAANVAVDDGFLGQYLVGYSNNSFKDLQIGAATANRLLFAYLAGNPGGTVGGIMDGTTGQITFGGDGGAVVPAFTLIQGTGAHSADIFLGNTAAAAADTHGFPYIPTLANAPSGAPNAFAGAGAALVYQDGAGGKKGLWARNITGGQWEFMPAAITTQGAGAGVWVTNNLPAGFGTTPKYWLIDGGFGGALAVVPYFTNP